MREEAVAFGYKIGWLAIPARSPTDIAAALQLDGVTAIGWQRGVELAYAGSVFVSPNVDGWNLVASTKFLRLSSEVGWYAWLSGLSEWCDEVQFFGTYRIVEYQAWSRARRGRVERAFVFLGESGEVVTNVGEQTAAERELGLRRLSEATPTDDLWAQDDPRLPDESDVLAMAGRWSVDPSRLDGIAATGEGLLGTLDTSSGPFR